MQQAQRQHSESGPIARPAQQAPPAARTAVPLAAAAVCRGEEASSPTQTSAKGDVEKGKSGLEKPLLGRAEAESGLAKPLLGDATKSRHPPFHFLGPVGVVLVLFFLAAGLASLGQGQESRARHAERLAQEQVNKELKVASFIPHEVAHTVAAGIQAGLGKQGAEHVMSEVNHTSLAFFAAAGVAGLCLLGLGCQARRPLASHRASGSW